MGLEKEIKFETFKHQKDFIKIRNSSFNLFKVLHFKGLRHVVNNYSKAQKKYKKNIGRVTGTSTYKQYSLEIEPHFMGFQPINTDRITTLLSEGVIDAVENLRNLLHDSDVHVPEYMLLWKKTITRMDIAFIYPHELPKLKAELKRFQTPEYIEWSGNSYMITRKKYEALIDNYKGREEAQWKKKETNILTNSRSLSEKK